MKHFFTSFSFQVRIVLLFAIVDAIVLFLGITFFYMYNKNATRENWEKVVKQTALLFSSRADNFIDVIDETTKRVHASKDVLEIARNLSLNQEININQYDYNSRHDYFSEHPKIRQEIQSILLNATITINHALLGRLSVLTTNFDRVSIYNRIGDLPLKKEKIKNMNVYQLGFNLTEYSALFGPYTDPWNNNQDLVMTLVRPLRDTFLFTVLFVTLFLCNNLLKQFIILLSKKTIFLLFLITMMNLSFLLALPMSLQTLPKTKYNCL